MVLRLQLTAGIIPRAERESLTTSFLIKYPIFFLQDGRTHGYIW